MYYNKGNTISIRTVAARKRMGDEGWIDMLTMSNTNTNQLLTPCEVAASVSFMSMNWVSQSLFLWKATF